MEIDTRGARVQPGDELYTRGEYRVGWLLASGTVDESLTRWSTYRGASRYAQRLLTNANVVQTWVAPRWIK